MKTENASNGWMNVQAGSPHAGKCGAALAALWVICSPLQAQSNTPPQAILIHPPAGRSYAAGAAIRLEVEATDVDDAVVRVDFFEGSTLLGTVTNAPYRLMFTNTMEVRPHTVFARATDSRGASSDSPAVRFYVGMDNAPPIVTIAAPSEGAVIGVPGTVVVSVVIDDDDDRPSLVTIYQDSQVAAVVGEMPYTAVISNLTVGSHVLRAKAVDPSINIAWSAEVHFTATHVALEKAQFLWGEGFKCRLTGLVVGHRTRILASRDARAWFSIWTRIPGTTEINFTDISATNYTQRFYRVSIE